MWPESCIGTGDMSAICIRTSNPRDPYFVDGLMGGNMSYRVSLAKECLPARELNHDVAFHWELDMALKIKKRGYRIVYEPGAAIDHHSAPRRISGMRTRITKGFIMRITISRISSCGISTCLGDWDISATLPFLARRHPPVWQGWCCYGSCVEVSIGSS